MEVLFCAEFRQAGYSFLLITAHSSWECPETGPDGTFHLFEQDISSVAPVSLWGRRCYVPLNILRVNE